MRKGIFVFLLSCTISFCKFLKTAFPFTRSQQEATMRSERSCCRQEGEEERRNLSDEVDELRTKFQTMCSEIAEMKNMLADALNKINKGNNDEEVISHDDGPMIFTFGSSAYSTVNNDKASMEDNINITVKAASTPPPVQSNFVFGGASTTATPTGASPFQFGSQQIPSPILFQASSGSQEFRGGDSSGRKIRRLKHRRRK